MRTVALVRSPFLAGHPKLSQEESAELSLLLCGLLGHFLSNQLKTWRDAQ